MVLFNTHPWVRRVLRGSVDSIPWHGLLTTRDDREAALHRIVFIE